eukprot:11646968-Heterocapsa_arctica.AAC.1
MSPSSELPKPWVIMASLPMRKRATLARVQTSQYAPCANTRRAQPFVPRGSIPRPSVGGHRCPSVDSRVPTRARLDGLLILCQKGQRMNYVV